MKNLMLIDAVHPEEVRVAIVEDGDLTDFDFTVAAKKQIKGNIYLAKITRVEPSLQAAFVEYGGNRQGFLPFAEIHPDYYQIPAADRELLLQEEAEYDEEQEKKYSRENRRRMPQRRDKKGTDNQPQATESGDKSAEIFGPAGDDETLINRRPDVDVGNPSDSNGDVTEGDNVDLDSFIITEPVISKNDEVFVSASFDGEVDGAENYPLDEAVQSSPDSDVESSNAPQSAQSSHHENLPESTSEAEELARAEGYEQVGGAEEEELVRPQKKFRFQKRYRIQEVIKKGQVILIQVIKEERGNKGASVSTYISLPGRYCVLMPNTMRQAGISRRISDQKDRQRLRSVTESLEIPKGMSVIVRTAGFDRSRPEIKRDYEYLLKLWATIREKTISSFAPSLVYEEADLIKRAIRDYYHPNLDEILVEGDEAFKSAKELMKMLMPSHAAKVKQYIEPTPLYEQYDVEEFVNSINNPIVKLRSGGYIVFDSTEALVAIDVNSGRSTGDRHIEETATRTNLEAAQEIARQIKLRDLAGLIVIDFIDMVELKNRKVVERALKESLKGDRAKIQLGRISMFGLLEMTRQRLRPSIIESTMSSCTMCSGTGLIKSTDALALEILRKIEAVCNQEGTDKITILTSQQAALYLHNNKRQRLAELESKSGIKILIEVASEVFAEGYKAEVNYKTGYSHQEKNRGKKFRGRDRNREERADSKKISFGSGAETYSDGTDEVASDDAISIEEASGEDAAEESLGESRGGRDKRRNRRRSRGGRGSRDRNEERVQESGSDENVESAAEGSALEGSEQKPEVSERGGRGRRRYWKDKVGENDGESQAEESSIAGTDSSGEETQPHRGKARYSDRKHHARGDKDADAKSEKPEIRTANNNDEPKPFRGIQKISEYGAKRESKPALTQAEAPEPEPNSSSEPAQESSGGASSGQRRSGWWSKLIKAE